MILKNIKKHYIINFFILSVVLWLSRSLQFSATKYFILDTILSVVVLLLIYLPFLLITLFCRKPQIKLYILIIFSFLLLFLSFYPFDSLYNFFLIVFFIFSISSLLAVFSNFYNYIILYFIILFIFLKWLQSSVINQNLEYKENNNFVSEKYITINYSNDLNFVNKFKTVPIDLSNIIKGWSGITGWYRTKYFKVTPQYIPLKGKIWIPVTKEKKTFPLILVVHGNQSFKTNSYLGYNYICRELVSRGFIVISVDAEFLNDCWIDNWAKFIPSIIPQKICNFFKKQNLCVFNTRNARSTIILEHLSLLKSWNNDIYHSLFDSIDFKNIAIVGHSLGAAASHNATIINKQLKQYNFNIKSIVSIAPAENIMDLQEENLYPKNINFLTIHGSYDGDVRTYQGIPYLNNIKYSRKDFFIKTGIYIFGATHNMFNTNWKKYDMHFPSSLILNNKKFLDSKILQDATCFLISSFFDLTLKKDFSKLPIFSNSKQYINKKFPTIFFHSIYEPSNIEFFAKLDNNNNKIKINTSNHNQKYIYTKLKNKIGSLDAGGIIFQWDDNQFPAIFELESQYSNINIKEKKHLNFWIANLNRKIFSSKKFIKNKIYYSIELEDNNNNIVEIRDFFSINPQIKKNIFFPLFNDTYSSSEYIFQTKTIPLMNYMNIRDNFHIKKIRFIFYKNTGRVLIKNIGFY